MDNGGESNTRSVAFVAGHPITHSRSPVIHTHWLEQLGLSGTYRKIDTPPDELGALMLRVRRGDFVGGNLTIPLKECALPLVDVLSERAARIGAVNTVWVKDGSLHGDNTDGEGFAANLDAGAPGWDGSGGAALVIGAGGAARAVVDAIVGRSMTVTVVNRTPERASDLVSALAPGGHAAGLDQLDASGFDLIVNTSAVGMNEEALPIDLRAAKPSCVVTDIVYTPLQTPLLQQARAVGLRTVDGLGMLLHQAAPGFERWFGQRPRVDAALRELVLASMGVSETISSRSKAVSWA